MHDKKKVTQNSKEKFTKHLWLLLSKENHFPKYGFKLSGKLFSTLRNFLSFCFIKL